MLSFFDFNPCVLHNMTGLRIMKKIALILLPLLLLPMLVMAAPERIAARTIIVTASSSGTPVSVTTGTNIWCTRATIIGNKAARTANTGTVYIGPESGNDTQAYPILTGEIHVFVAPPGASLNLADWYVDVATNDDGLVIIYEAQ
jgi:hypothetical protein